MNCLFDVDIGAVLALQRIGCGFAATKRDGAVVLLFGSLRRHLPADIVPCDVRMVRLRNVHQKHFLGIYCESFFSSSQCTLNHWIGTRREAALPTFRLEALGSCFGSSCDIMLKLFHISHHRQYTRRKHSNGSSATHSFVILLAMLMSYVSSYTGTFSLLRDSSCDEQ